MSTPYSPHPICQNAKSVALVANGAMEDYRLISSLVKKYDKCVAVDGGLIHCHGMGIRPDLIIGDGDSIPEELAARYVDIPSVSFPVDKDESDLELAIYAANWPNVEKMAVFGAMGKRSDQAIANLQLLRRFSTKLVIETETETILSISGRNRIDGFSGQRISLIPIGPSPSGITTKGLKWELKDATLDAHFFSLSNVCLGSSFEVNIAHGDVLCFLLGRS